MADTVAHRVQEVRERIAAACRRSGREAEEVRLIAVTKQQEPAVIAALQAAGVADLGENRVEHLRAMAAAAGDAVRFHYIGRVQGRQLAKIVPLCRTLHSLCEEGHVGRLARACREHEREMPVFLQVNPSGEEQKAGLRPEAVSPMLERIAAHEPWLRCVGLMCMAPDADLPGVDDGVVRRCFATLRELARHHRLPRLSMGMSKDYELDVEEGATDVRIGSVLFSATQEARS